MARKDQTTSRRNALWSFLQTTKTAPDAESLSRSYGVPLSEVQHLIRSMDNAR